MSDVAVPRRQLLDSTVRKACEVVDSPGEGRECGSPRLVGDRDRDVGAACERLQQGPFRARQILESVREHRLALPRIQLASEPLGGGPPQQVTVPQAEPLERVPVCRVEGCEIAVELGRLDEARLELADTGQQRVGEPSEARRATQAVHRRTRRRNRAACDERALGVAGNAARRAFTGDLLEKVVERPDGAAEERRLQAEQLAFDAVDVRPVRHDQVRLARKRVQIAPQEKRHLPRVRGAGDEHQTQLAHATSGS